MSADERNLRFENAMATLAELAARHDERMAQHDEHMAQHNERIASLEKSFQTLTQLAVSASERADQHGAWINQLGTAQAESDVKIAALADAQIHTEEGMNALRAAQTNSDAKLAALADAQIRTEEALTRLTLKVNDLTELVRGGRNGRNES